MEKFAKKIDVSEEAITSQKEKKQNKVHPVFVVVVGYLDITSDYK